MKKLLVFFSFVLLCSVSAMGQAVPSKSVPVAENFPGGQDSLYTFINQKLIYPPLAKRNRMQGECVVSFTINEDGSVSDIRVVKEQGGGTGKEAARLVKLLKFDAIGYKLKSSIPIIFKL